MLIGLLVLLLVLLLSVAGCWRWLLVAERWPSLLLALGAVALLALAAAVGLGAVGPCRCRWVLVPDRCWSRGCSQYIFRLGWTVPCCCLFWVNNA